ncbi:MAG: 16S rRNA processing protein RimM [Gemmatimonadetes bacterium]|nr:16S rRNA processing protein RimM [Gemmatimonadota bacterium]
MNAQDLIIVGRIRKAHGIRGEVVVELMTESPDVIFAPGARLFPGTAEGDPDPKLGPIHVEDARPFREQFLVTFVEVPDRTEAERWRDRFLLVPQSELVPPEEGAVYQHQLIGLSVRTEAEGEIGRVVGTFEVAGRLLLEVARESGTVLLPYEGQFVDRVDLAAGHLHMTLPPGLLE